MPQIKVIKMIALAGAFFCHKFHKLSQIELSQIIVIPCKKELMEIRGEKNHFNL